MYQIIFVGKPYDGMLLASESNEHDAIIEARRLWVKYLTSFDPVCGGIMIVCPDGSVLENW